MTARLGLAVMAAACVLAACAKDPDSKPASPQASETDFPEERIKLPGFSIDAPKGEVAVHSKSPSVGKYQVNLKASLADHFVEDVARDSQFVATWTYDASTREEWDNEYLTMYVEALKKVVPGARVLHREDVAPDRWFVIVGNERAPVAAGVVQCDPHFEVGITLTRYHDVQRMVPLVARTLRSVQCEVKDENRSGLFPVTRLPQTFGSVPTEDGWMFRSIDGEMLVLNFTTGRLPDDPKLLRAVILAMLKAINLSVPDSALIALKPDPQVRPGVVTLSRARLADADHLYIGSLFCEPVGATLMFIWAGGPRPTDAQAWERFGQVDCPGAAATTTAKFSTLVEQACAAGDSAACAIQKEPKD